MDARLKQLVTQIEDLLSDFKKDIPKEEQLDGSVKSMILDAQVLVNRYTDRSVAHLLSEMGKMTEPRTRNKSEDAKRQQARLLNLYRNYVRNGQIVPNHIIEYMVSIMENNLEAPTED